MRCEGGGSPRSSLRRKPESRRPRPRDAMFSAVTGEMSIEPRHRAKLPRRHPAHPPESFAYLVIPAQAGIQKPAPPGWRECGYRHPITPSRGYAKLSSWKYPRTGRSAAAMRRYNVCTWRVVIRMPFAVTIAERGAPAPWLSPGAAAQLGRSASEIVARLRTATMLSLDTHCPAPTSTRPSKFDVATLS